MSDFPIRPALSLPDLSDRTPFVFRGTLGPRFRPSAPSACGLNSAAIPSTAPLEDPRSKIFPPPDVFDFKIIKYDPAQICTDSTDMEVAGSSSIVDKKKFKKPYSGPLTAGPRSLPRFSKISPIGNYTRLGKLAKEVMKRSDEISASSKPLHIAGNILLQRKIKFLQAASLQSVATPTSDTNSTSPPPPAAASSSGHPSILSPTYTPTSPATNNFDAQCTSQPSSQDTAPASSDSSCTSAWNLIFSSDSDAPATPCDSIISGLPNSQATNKSVENILDNTVTDYNIAPPSPATPGHPSITNLQSHMNFMNTSSLFDTPNANDSPLILNCSSDENSLNSESPATTQSSALIDATPVIAAEGNYLLKRNIARRSSYKFPHVTSRIGGVAHFVFPLVDFIKCTEAGCNKQFACPKFSLARQSLLRHLDQHHSLPGITSKYWCSYCQRQTRTKISSHPCLKNERYYDVNLFQSTYKYRCSQCKVSFPTNKGLVYHLIYHNRRNDTNARHGNVSPSMNNVSPTPQSAPPSPQGPSSPNTSSSNTSAVSSTYFAYDEEFDGPATRD